MDNTLTALRETLKRNWDKPEKDEPALKSLAHEFSRHTHRHCTSLQLQLIDLALLQERVIAVQDATLRSYQKELKVTRRALKRAERQATQAD